MKFLFLAILLVSTHIISVAQQYVIHKDLLGIQARNTAYKNLWNSNYANKLDEIKSDREKVASYLTVIEAVQNKIYSSLVNVDDAIKNGKTLGYISKKIPLIFNNLSEAAKLAIGKPYLLIMVQNQSQVFIARITNLSNYLRDIVLSQDEQILIDQAKRDRFVYEVYQEINVLYHLSQSIVDQFKMHNLSDAINEVVPYKLFINVDKIIVNGILTKLKFF